MVTEMVHGQKLARPQALVFDLDGTLVDSVGDISVALNRCLEAFGLPARTSEEIRGYLGEGSRVLVQRVLPVGSEELAEPLLAAFLADYLSRCCEQTRAYPGVVELLDELGARKLPLAVLSNKPHQATVEVVTHVLGLQRFAAVKGKQPGVPTKPAPDAALALLDELGLAPERCWLVGDSAVDVHTAQATGLSPVGVLWGYRDELELRQAGAAALLRRPAELLELLDSSADADS